MENQKDHDLLIKVATRVDSLCSKIDALTTQNAAEHADIIKSITDERKSTENKLARKTDVWIFRTALAIIATVIMGMSYSVVENNKNISSIVNEFEDHSAFAAIAWEKFTGQPWGAASRLELKEAKERYQLERKHAKEREMIMKE